MASFFSGLLDWLRGLFFSKELEITLVGLQNAGKAAIVYANRGGANPW